MTQATKFIHLRRTDLNGWPNEQPTVSCHGGATVAYQVADDNTITYAVAQCNMNDHFNKAIGRAKAGGRLNSNAFRRQVKETEQEFFKRAQMQWSMTGSVVDL